MHSIPPRDSLVKMPPPSARPPSLDAAALPRLLPDVAVVFDACHAPLVADCVRQMAQAANISVTAAWLGLLCGDWDVIEEEVPLLGERLIPIRLLPNLALSPRRQAA